MTMVDRLADRIKNDTGNIISDEDLYDLVKQAVQKAFFEPTKTSDRWDAKLEPSLALATAQDLLKETITKHIQSIIDKWIAENSDEFMKMMTEAFLSAPQKIIEGIVHNFLADLVKYRMEQENMKLQWEAKNKQW